MEFLGWYDLVMKMNARFPGDRPLITIVYKYNFWKVLGFISTEGDRSTDPSDTYSSHFPDTYSNFSI